jgi:hypothetical protein
MTASIEAREVRVAGHQLRCQVCDFTRFFRRETRLATGASAFGQDWMNSKADCYVCEQCGFVHWFLPTHGVAAAVEDTSLADEIELLRQRLAAEYDDALEGSTTR